MTSIVAPPDSTLTQTPTADFLNGFVGKHIKDICDCGYHHDNDNHCAHFVSHALGFHFGRTCKTMTGKGRIGANISVLQLFPMCGQVGDWKERDEDACLAFVLKTSKVDLEAQTLDYFHQEHVGVFLNGTIWHYSNRQRKVVTQTPQDFSHHYPGNQHALYYGTFPS